MGENMKVPTWKMNILKMEFSSMIWLEFGIHDIGGGKKKFMFDTAEEAGGVL